MTDRCQPAPPRRGWYAPRASPRPQVSRPPVSRRASSCPARWIWRWCSTRSRPCRGRCRAQPGQGRHGAVDSAGADHRAPARGDPQLRRRQRRCTGPWKLPGPPCHRRRWPPLSDWGTETGAIEVGVCSGLIGDRLPMDKVLAGVQEIVHEMAGGIVGGEEAARAIMTTDTVPKQVALHHVEQLDRRRHGQGCRHAGTVAGHHAERHHHRCAGRHRRAGPGAAPRHRPDIRPARRRRQLLHQRHRAAAGLRRQRNRAQSSRSRRRGAAGVRRPVRPAAGRRRGRDQTDRRHRPRRGAEGRTRSPPPGGGPRQPGQDRAVRLRRQLGPGARRQGMAPVRLDHRISVSFNGSPVCIDEVGAPGARDVDLSGADIDVTIDLGVRDGRASIRTDLSHGYVEEGIRPTAHDGRGGSSGQGRCARRGAAVAQAAARQDRRRQVRRQRNDRRHAAARLRRRHGLPAQLQDRSSCTAADLRSAPCSNGSVSQAISRAASGSPRPRCSTWRGWCCSDRSAANWSI